MSAPAERPVGSEPNPDDSEKFDDALIDELANAPRNLPDTKVDSRIDDEKYKELRAANVYRKALVVSTLVTVGALVIAATAFMALYIGSQWAHIEASVMIAYFASVVAESVGILYVIARYLFPHSGRAD
ncbi:hypothetical protein [Mycobacterium malmoense]|uniref:hypothetical protein n=1 Tax=Mycobacterium malmoense TaxID=1780 RepID=UPI0008F8636F|nr:hypothetical protein [Mycobacterium malmoense]OIN79788.1 hypothetical protein BMG05_16720 [Mycobacterium malmoense]